ncbi:nuclear transport factor 2 family protein [Cereibacter sp. SYSU M97828]|nr:nuclear transport factor 2 family protein [Cereibacter flavus]
MDLPEPIDRFFRATDGATLASAFAAHAVVHDEGETHRGPDAIRAWWQSGKDRYCHSTRPEAIDGTTVHAHVSGDFPGSPARLRFAFVIEDDLIARLEIK